MTLIEIIKIAVPAIAYLIIFLYQKQKIDALTNAITTQKTSIEAQTSTIAAVKTQADGQVAITTRLEAIVDRTERHATTVLTNHEKLIQLVEDRAAREKQELEDRAEREKQKSEALLEVARGELSEREEAIKGAGIQPELASLLSALSQESFATKEMLTSLKADISKLISFNKSIYINAHVNSMDSTDSANNKYHTMNSKTRV